MQAAIVARHADLFTPEQLEGVSIHYVSTIEEVLDIALPGTQQQARQDEETRERVLTNVS